MKSAQSETARRHMVDSQLRTSGINTPWIVAVMGTVPREKFLAPDKAAFAYQDRAVPLGNGRMLNPPIAAAQMLQTAEIRSDDNVLIIGAGSGYLAALLAGRAETVVALEADPALAGAAKDNVPEIRLVEAPLTGGAPDYAPYSVILIDGAIEQLPAAIEAQLDEGGRIVTGLVDGAISRLAMGTKHGGHVALRSLADMEIAPLPGFERAREFVF